MSVREQELYDACMLAWEHLRSTYEVANRKGVDTNWEAFEKRTIQTISDVVTKMGFIPKMPNMVVTAKGFRNPKYNTGDK